MPIHESPTEILPKEVMDALLKDTRMLPRRPAPHEGEKEDELMAAMLAVGKTACISAPPLLE